MSRGQMDLSVPFEERRAAKDLGARWDSVGKVWFVPFGRDIAEFRRWWPVELKTKVSREHEKILLKAIGNRADFLRGK